MAVIQLLSVLITPTIKITEYNFQSIYSYFSIIIAFCVLKSTNIFSISIFSTFPVTPISIG